LLTVPAYSQSGGGINAAQGAGRAARPEEPRADPAKKKAFIESITSGNFHSQAAKGSESAISCMMARTAAYKGHEVTWDEIMKSKEEWDPKINLEKLT